MSLGLWLSEQMRYDPDTGRLLTHDTWVIMFFLHVLEIFFRYFQIKKRTQINFFSVQKRSKHTKMFFMIINRNTNLPQVKTFQKILD